MSVTCDEVQGARGRLVIAEHERATAEAVSREAEAVAHTATEARAKAIHDLEMSAAKTTALEQSNAALEGSLEANPHSRGMGPKGRGSKLAATRGGVQRWESMRRCQSSAVACWGGARPG